jgi:hypothetical protein
LVSGWTVIEAQTRFLGFAALVTMPIGGLLGALWGMRRGRRPRRPPLSPEEWRRRPNRIVDVRRDQNER